MPESPREWHLYRTRFFPDFHGGTEVSWTPGWAGYMGVAIRFKGDGTFDYWFYTDVSTGKEPKYPASGTWKWAGDILELTSDHPLHDTRWHVYQHKGEATLLPAYAREWQLKDGKTHEDRLLFRVPDFDPGQPFASQRFDRSLDANGR